MSARPPRRSAAQRRAELRRRRLTALAVLGGVVLGLVAAVAALAGGGDGGGSEQATATTPRKTPPPVQIQWVGDTTLGSDAGDPPDGARSLFTNVRSRLQNSDFTFANLEGTLAADAPNNGSKCGSDGGSTCFAFAAPQANAAALKWAGIDIVNVANNHANDYGPAGEYSTIKALFAHGIAHTGLPHEITILTHRGTRVAFLGFAPYRWAASLLDIPGAQALIRQAAQEADVVVVAMHAGAEGAGQTHTPVGVEEAYGEDRGNTRGFAHAAVDAGADLVVASGPHVLRGLETYNGKLIAYSLGNFAGWKNFAQGGVLSLSGMLRVTLSGKGVPLAARFTPLTLADPGVPEYDPSGQSITLVNQLSKDDFGANAATISPGGTITLASAAGVR